jgi:hypothetical protein
MAFSQGANSNSTPRVKLYFVPHFPSHVVCTDLLPIGSCLSSMKLYLSMTRDNYVPCTVRYVTYLNEKEGRLGIVGYSVKWVVVF